MSDLFSSNKLSYGGTGWGFGGPVGAAFGYGLGGSMDVVNEDYGGDWGSYIADNFTRPWSGNDDDKWYDKLGKISDPGGVFKGLFGGDKKKKETKIAGKTQGQWVDELSMTEEEFQNNLTTLMRTLGTSAAESRNRSSEIAARERLPAATQLAAERGTNIQMNEAVLAGEERLIQLKEQLDRQAKQVVMQTFAKKESTDEAYLKMQEQQSSAQINNLLNLLGQYLGEQYFGNENQDWPKGGPDGLTGEPYEYWRPSGYYNPAIKDQTRTNLNQYDSIYDYG